MAYAVLCDRTSCRARTRTVGWAVPVFVLCIIAHLHALQVVRIAQFPHGLSSTFPIGDADRNDLDEVYGRSHDTLVAFECQRDGSFRRIAVKRVPNLWNVRDFGDGDKDGRMEVIVDGTGDSILESPDSSSMPSASVWGVCYGEIWDAKYIDLDRDGRQEVALNISSGGHGICLFENSGDNQYDSVWVFPKPPNGTEYGQFVVADFDQDSLMELVTCGSGNFIDVFEGTGENNQYVLSAQCTTGMYANWNIAAAHDMDHNGWPEFIVIGTDTLSPHLLRMMIFESTGHPHYQVVWQQSLADFSEGFFGNPISVGDVDGDGTMDFAANSGWGVVLFKCTGPHEYARVWSRETTGFWLRLFDINRDGRAEIIFDGPRGTEIWEDTEGLGVAEFSKFSQESPVKVTPSVARFGAPLLFSSIPSGADIEVLSLDGRLVSRTQGARQSTWTWNLRNQSGNLVPAGTYFAVIRSKGKATSLKLCVVK